MVGPDNEAGIVATKEIAKLVDKRAKAVEACFATEPLTILHNLNQRGEDIAYEEISDHVSKTRDGRHNAEGYKYWLGISHLLAADFATDLGESIEITDRGRRYLEEYAPLYLKEAAKE